MKLTLCGSSWGSTIALVVLTMTTLLVLTTGQASEQSGNSARRNRRQNSNRRGRNRMARFGCEEIYLPMCKGLIPYSYTKLPNRFNHTTQAEVHRALERLWIYMDHSCSRNTRVLACALYLPKCHGRRPGMAPCRSTCTRAKRKCARPLSRQMSFTWRDEFNCRSLSNSRCVRPVRERPCAQQHTNCVQNNVFPVCANLSFTWGTMPNMFGQCNTEEINTEIEQYNALVATNCHQSLKFLLCGVYAPFCVRSEQPFTFPCREICEEIRESCESHYQRLYHNLPWPQKLQCHRYPATDDETFQCVMPNEGATFQGNTT